MKLREQLLFYLKSLHCPGPLLVTPVRRQKISKTKREQKTRAKTYQIRYCYSYTVEKEWLKRPYSTLYLRNFILFSHFD